MPDSIKDVPQWVVGLGAIGAGAFALWLRIAPAGKADAARIEALIQANQDLMRENERERREGDRRLYERLDQMNSEMKDGFAVMGERVARLEGSRPPGE